MLYLTGDTHGQLDRFKSMVLVGRTILICGDFGLPWGGQLAERDTYCLDWLAARRRTRFLFLDGNHENFDLLGILPVKEWQGGRVHELRPNVLHLMRGEVFEIEGLTVFAFGGARSVDKDTRIPHESWWPQEMPTKADYENAIQNLKRVGNRVDLVVTHAAPLKFLQSEAGKKYRGFETEIRDETSLLLSAIQARIHYKAWFFGHYHTEWLDRRYRAQCLYQSIVTYDGGGLPGIGE